MSRTSRHTPLRSTLTLGLSLVLAMGAVAPAFGQDMSAAADASGAQMSQYGDGKRVALLIAQSDYRGAPFPAATADVTMLANQFGAAGFSIESGVDLPEYGISERVRQLVERLTLSGPDSTVLVYLSGRFAQIKGENILLPVGAPLDRASDAALNGFNIGKLFSALETVPARMRIVIIDAGPSPEALTREANVAPGLSIIDPPAGFIVSYSQGPNRQLVDSITQPGVYSMALLENILQPSASLSEMFRNIRLRVHSETNGRQVPWEASKLNGQDFSFYTAASPNGDTRPVVKSLTSMFQARELSRDEAYMAVVADDSISSYQSFLEAFPDDEAVPSVQYNLAVRREAEVWGRVTRDDSPDAYWTYIDSYPDGGNAMVARERLSGRGYSQRPPGGFAPMAFMDLPPPLPGREIIASSASMPLEMAPRAPRMHMPAAPVLVGAAAAAALVAVAAPAMRAPGGGRQLPVVAGAAIRPSWAAPAPRATPAALSAPQYPATRPGMGAPAALAPAPATPGVRPLMGGAPSTQGLAQPGAPAAGANVRPLMTSAGPGPAPSGNGALGVARPLSGTQPQPLSAAAPAPRALVGAQGQTSGAAQQSRQVSQQGRPARAAQAQQAAGRRVAAQQVYRAPAQQRAPARSCSPGKGRKC